MSHFRNHASLKKFATLGLAAALFSPASNAAVATFEIVLSTELVEILDPSSCSISSTDSFGCDIAVDDVFKGEFTLDDSQFALAGTDMGVNLDSFSLTIGTLIWDMHDINSAFYGFRGPELSATSPAFNIANNDIENFGKYGGVYGASDVPFCDFFSADHDFFDRNYFSAFDGAVRVEGSLSLSRIPLGISEPSTWFLGITGILALAGLRKRT